MLDASGPKKVIDYSKAQIDDEDLSSFDLDQGSGNFKPSDAVEGQYRMKHTNQKFSLTGVKAQQEESITQEYPKALTEEEQL